MFLSRGGLPGSNVKIISVGAPIQCLKLCAGSGVDRYAIDGRHCVAYHIGTEKKRKYHRYLQINEDENE